MCDGQEKLIKKYQKERRLKKIRYGITSICLIVISILFLKSYVNLEKGIYVESEEDAKINYKVNLNENDFYPENYVDEGTNVIASLINNIETEFKYNLNLSDEIEYMYNYKITAKLEVLEGGKDDVVFASEEDLVVKELQTSTSKKLCIDEILNIDYGAYNDKISKFIKTYNLSNMTNRLVLTMYLYATNCYDGTQINKDSRVMTIEIPLTTQTVDVGITTNVAKNKGKVLVSKKELKYSKYFLAVGILLLIIGILEFLRFLKYLINTRTAETMYEQTLKCIMISYKSYIQQINSVLNENGYEKLEVGSFDELINMRDVVNSPILMYNEEKYRTKFMLANENRLFVYVLDAGLIRENLREKSKIKKAKKENEEKNNAW